MRLADLILFAKQAIFEFIIIIVHLSQTNIHLLTVIVLHKLLGVDAHDVDIELAFLLPG